MHRLGWARVGFALSYLYLTSPALAQGVLYSPDQQPSSWTLNKKPTPWDISLAVGAAMQPTFHGSDRYRVSPVPLVIVRWHDAVSLGVEGLSAYWHHNNLRIGAGVNYEGGRLDHQSDGILSGGDDRLKGLGNVASSVGLRGFLSYRFGPVDVDTSVTKYIGANNKGVLANVGLSAQLPMGKRLVFRPHVGSTWADDNYMRTFFGVSSTQALRSRFPQFATGSGIEDINGGITAVYLLNKHWFLGADASVTRYLGGAARSPITRSNTNATVASVIGYHF
jgi:outer membrane scaffolding protein for murein synthesis (MipA/OmpV family)